MIDVTVGMTCHETIHPSNDQIHQYQSSPQGLIISQILTEVTNDMNRLVLCMTTYMIVVVDRVREEGIDLNDMMTWMTDTDSWKEDNIQITYYRCLHTHVMIPKKLKES